MVFLSNRQGCAAAGLSVETCGAEPLRPASMNCLTEATLASSPQSNDVTAGGRVLLDSKVSPPPEARHMPGRMSSMPFSTASDQLKQQLQPRQSANDSPPNVHSSILTPTQDQVISELTTVVDDLGAETREITVHMQQVIGHLQNAWKTFLTEEATIRKSLVSHFDERISGVESSVAALETNVMGVTSSVEVLEANLKGVTSGVAAFEADMKGMTSSVAAFEADMKGVMSDVAAIEFDMNGHQQQFATLHDLEAEVQARRELQSGLRGRVEALAALREGTERDLLRRFEESQRHEALARLDLAKRIDATEAHEDVLEQSLKELQHDLVRFQLAWQTQEHQFQGAFDWTNHRPGMTGRIRSWAGHVTARQMKTPQIPPSQLWPSSIPVDVDCREPFSPHRAA